MSIATPPPRTACTRCGRPFPSGHVAHLDESTDTPRWLHLHCAAKAHRAKTTGDNNE